MSKSTARGKWHQTAPLTKVDYLIVGSGLTGAVIARLLADAGREVLVLERRSQVGGNVADRLHTSGIRVHPYGPHYFRTSSERIWKFVKRFASFHEYVAQVTSNVDGRHENWPIAASYIRRTVGDQWAPVFKGTPANFEEASLAMMPRVVYEKFVKGYTEKQWGVPARLLSASLATRFDVREDDDRRLKKHEYQGIPREGYTAFMLGMLSGIPVVTNVDYLKNGNASRPHRLLVFTGPIDEFFGYDLGRLAYRGQDREETYLPNVDYFQPCGQVNNPDLHNGPHIRTIEWKHMMPKEYADRIRGTVLTRETTISPTDADRYEYPFPDQKNQRLYARYRERANSVPGLLICGRLGEYRYYDMDQAIGRAMKVAKTILEGKRPRAHRVHFVQATNVS